MSMLLRTINSTDTPETSPHVFVIVSRTIFLTFCAFMTIGGNLLSMVVLKRMKSVSEVPKIFLLSLAFTDLCMGVLTGLFSIIPAITSTWPYGIPFCQVVGTSGSVFCGISLLSLLFVSVDRYIAISKPLHYVTLVTTQRAVFVVTSIWISTSVLVITSTLIKGQIGVIYNPNLCTCMVAWGDTRFTAFNLTTLFAFIMVPSIGMLLLYVRLFLISRRHIRKITEMSVSNGRPIISKKEGKAITTFFVVTGAFNVAWMPFLVAHSYMTISGNSISDGALFCILWLAISNSWWNVFIYSITNRAYRVTASVLLKSLLRCNRNTVHGFYDTSTDTNNACNINVVAKRQVNDAIT